MIEVQCLQIDKTKRSIVISDIHANLKLFKKLLNQLNYTENDYLFINGDLCEKGPNSLEVVKYIRDLAKQSDKVHVTKGNCDVVFRYVFDGVEGIISYMNKQKHSILNEMLDRYDKSLDDFSSLQELANFYRYYFHDEINWLESLPIAYETDNYIIIHAGIEALDNWCETEENVALYTPAFYEKEHHANKTVIVGHWPVVNYRAKQVSSHNPIIDLNKGVISLDGGNQIKRDGQLNALIIENDRYSFSYVDELDHGVIVQKDYIDTSNRTGTVTYPNYEVRKIKEEQYFTLCENIKLGILQWVKNEYLTVKDGRTFCKGDISTTFLSVMQGEKVNVVDNKCAGYMLIKKDNGEVGWIPSRIYIK